MKIEKFNIEDYTRFLPKSTYKPVVTGEYINEYEMILDSEGRKTGSLKINPETGEVFKINIHKQIQEHKDRCFNLSENTIVDAKTGKFYFSKKPDVLNKPGLSIDMTEFPETSAELIKLSREEKDRYIKQKEELIRQREIKEKEQIKKEKKQIKKEKKEIKGDNNE